MAPSEVSFTTQHFDQVEYNSILNNSGINEEVNQIADDQVSAFMEQHICRPQLSNTSSSSTQVEKA